MGDNNKNKWYKGRKWYHKRGGKSKNNTDASTSKKSDTNTVLTAVVPQQIGPYKGWKLYHPQEDYKKDSDTEKKVKAIEVYVQKNKSTFDVKSMERCHVCVDLKHLLSDDEVLKLWFNLNEELNMNPRYTLDCMGLAFHQVFDADEKIVVRPMNHNVVLPLTNLKMNYYGKLVTIRGTVIKVGSPTLLCKSMAFECLSCHGTQAIMQPQGIYTLPTSCPACGGLGKFEPLKSSPFTVTVDYQTVKIQETQSQGVAGSIPRSIEVEFHDDLISLVSPGDLISVTGIVQVRDEGRGDDGKKSARLMQLYIEAVAVHNQRTLNHPTLTFTIKDYYAIQEIHSSDDVFQLLVQSLCPSIFGHEIVKAGLILGLMGGTEIEDGSRCNPHVLIVGDPGLGKSQLLQAATLAAPRGVYVCGNACTASGLTVSLSRTQGAGFTLEAGSLVLADRGICCVDELDKLGTGGHGALLEAMEQGTVSVARGGVVCRLAAAPTVLAAANPAQGHYDRSKTVSENLKLGSALLSRFDLVFILLDRPNEQFDVLVSDHVLGNYNNGNSSTFNKTNLSDCESSTSQQINLSERLKIKPGDDFHPLPLVLLRKYIAYSKKYVHPKLSNEAAVILKGFFMSIRSAHKSNKNGPPITTRQLEACIRLTQARARVNLREEATAEDAKDVIEIMKHSLIHTMCDEFGSLQMSRSIHGSGMSARSQVKKFMEIIMREAGRSGKNVFTRNHLRDLHKAAKLSGDPSTLIEALHVHGYILQKEPGVYKLLSV